MEKRVQFLVILLPKVIQIWNLLLMLREMNLIRMAIFWSDSNISSEFNNEWINIIDDATQVSFTSNDSSTESIQIGLIFLFMVRHILIFLLLMQMVGLDLERIILRWYNGNIPSVDYH